MTEWETGAVRHTSQRQIGEDQSRAPSLCSRLHGSVARACLVPVLWVACEAEGEKKDESKEG